MVIFLIGVVLICAVLSLIVYARWNWGSLETQGIPVVPSSHWLLGGALLTYEKNGGLLDIEHMKKYGAVWGLYEGREPQIFICDPELIRLITTKDSAHFDAKRPIDFSDPIFNELLDFQPLEKWKTMRGMMGPPFNSLMKLKQANPAMRETIKDHFDNIKSAVKEKGGVLENFNLNQAIFSLLTDLLARSQYSINIGNSKRFVEIIQVLMTPPATESPLMAYLGSYSYAFPFIKHLLPNTNINPAVTREMVELLRQMMDMRRKQYQTGEAAGNKDLLDNIIEWKDTLKTNKEWQEKGVTEMSILSLGIGAFIGGQDQISLILSALWLHLTQNPDKLARLQEEVDKVWEEHKGTLDHESVNDMPYLNACVTEATRLHPFFFRSERVCTQDWEEPTWGIKIKKGNVVQLPIWAANRLPKYFEDPEDFKPERFLPGQKEKLHAYAFTSFGFGPRNCIGKRFAYEVMMLLMASLVREFTFLERENTKLNFLPAGPFFAASEPIHFDVKVRSH